MSNVVDLAAIGLVLVSLTLSSVWLGITATSNHQVALTTLALTRTLKGIVLGIGRAFYNAFLHPLRKYPGPLSHHMTVIPRSFYQFRGQLPFHVTDLHRRYGPIVRIAPNELAFSSPQAWRDIYGHKTGKEEFPKYRGLYRVFRHVPTSIVNADSFEHGQLRRQLAGAFSDRAMRDQEPIIGSYVNLLISRLKDAVKVSIWSLNSVKDCVLGGLSCPASPFPLPQPCGTLQALTVHGSY
jgi:hypothetical protein